MSHKSDSFWASTKPPLLAQDRKDAIRQNLQRYIRTPQPSVSAALSLRWKMLTASVAATFSLSSMGLCYAADSAVPGDALYPVKIHVNEVVLSTLTVTDQAQADWDVRLAERRIEEERVLLARGTLTGALLITVQANTASHLEVASERLETFAAEHPAQAEILRRRVTRAAIAHTVVFQLIKDRLEEQASASSAQTEPTADAYAEATSSAPAAPVFTEGSTPTLRDIFRAQGYH